MYKIIGFLPVLLALLISTGCSESLEVETTQEVDTINQAEVTNQVEEDTNYVILANGDLQVHKGNEIATLEINALPDSQIIEDENERLLILTDPSDQYQHGILGDSIEARSVTIVDVVDQPKLISRFEVSQDWVIESIRPIWSDWDGDGQREILLTLSNSSSGAKLVLYDEKGNTLAESAPIGKGSRWRQALTIGAFGENGQRLLVDVKTPHIGGIVNFYHWDKVQKVLEIEASLAGYSTHDIGSRVMTMYTLISGEDDEQALLVLPTQSKRELVALRLVSGEIKEEWRTDLGGRLSGSIDVVEEDGVSLISAIVDSNREVILNIPE